MSKTSQHRQKAQNYIKKGRLDSAINEYQRLIQMDSRNPNLYNELGDLYLKTGDRIQAVLSFEKASINYEKVALYNNAVAVCKKILRIVPDRIDTIFKLGELKSKQKFGGEAVGYFLQYLQHVASDLGSVDGVQEKLDLMLEFVHDREELVSAAAEVYRSLGFKVKAAELLNGLIDRLEVEGESHRAEAYREKVDEVKSSFSTEELKAFDKLSAVEDRTTGSDHDVEETADEAAEEGMEETPVGTSDEAAEEPAGEAIEEPAEEAAGETDYEAGRAVEPAIDEVFGEDDTDTKADTAAANAGRGSGASVPAADQPSAVGGMGAQARATGSIPQDVAVEEPPAPAEERVDAAPGGMVEEQIDTVSDTVSDTILDGGTGAAADGESPESDWDESGDDGEAFDFAREITSDVEEDDYRSHYDLGMAYIEMALYDEAIKELQIASRSDQLHLRSVEMISHCFLKQDNPRLAVKQLQRVLDKAKDAGLESLGIYYNLGVAYEMLGEDEKARECFEEVCIVDITFRDIAEKMKDYCDSD